MPDEADRLLRRATAGFLQLEHILYVALGLLLSLVAVAALGHAAFDAAASIVDWSAAGGIFAVIDQLLFVLMLVEILHTVRVSLRSGTLNAEPFLIVGLIASIRRVLVITLESSGIAKERAAQANPDMTFRASMTELIVLSLLILVMVVSIFLVRRSNAWRIPVTD